MLDPVVDAKITKYETMLADSSFAEIHESIRAQLAILRTQKPAPARIEPAVGSNILSTQLMAVIAKLDKDKKEFEARKARAVAARDAAIRDIELLENSQSEISKLAAKEIEDLSTALANASAQVGTPTVTPPHPSSSPKSPCRTSHRHQI